MKEEKKNSKRIVELLLGLAVVGTMAAVLSWLFGVVGMCGGERVTQISEGWYYLQDGERHSVELPITLAVEEPLEICYDGLTRADAGKVLTTKGAQYGLTITLNGEILFQYSEEYFERNTQMKSKQDCDAQIPIDFEEGTLKLTYETPVKGKIQLSQVYLGRGGSVMLYHLEDVAPTFVIVSIFAVLSVIAIGIAIYMHEINLTEPRFVDAAFFLLLCSVWFVTDSSIIQQRVGHPAIVCVVSFYAFMLLAIPMVHFVKNTGDMGKYRVLDWLLWAFYLNALLQGILNFCFKVKFVDMLFVTHLLLAAGVAIAFILLIREYRKEKTREIWMILTAFAVLGASGVLALILYWLLEIPYYGDIFEFGILIFVILTLANIVITMAENIHYKTEMQVYQRMAREDWMTGMENRQPFEEALTEIQRTVGDYKNVALIFMDLNRLKATNDEAGHAAGDELILGAAKCITAAFGEFGSCYRVGGDEFSVLIPNPEGTEEEWFARLDREIQKYNRNSRYKLSIARGWSCLKKEDGSCKTISDWKYEADYKMYENKGGFKRV